MKICHWHIFNRYYHIPLVYDTKNNKVKNTRQNKSLVKYTNKHVSDNLKMTSFIINENRIRIAKGYYAIVGGHSDQSFFHPEKPYKFNVPDIDSPKIYKVKDDQVLVIPIGSDELGSRGRTLEIGSETIVAFDRIALFPVTSKCISTYTNGIADKVIVEVLDKGMIYLDSMIILIKGLVGNQDEIWIETKVPGCFILGDLEIDMDVEGWSSAFDYGSDEFNQALDDDGIFFDLISVRETLRKSSGEFEKKALNMLAGKGPFGQLAFSPRKDKA